MKTLNFAELLNVAELPVYLDRVESAMLSAITTENPNISQPASRVAQSAGKRLRPMLVIASAAPKAINESVIDAGAAVELAHLATLVHDDIIDDSETRWGNRTVFKQDGLDSAILVGDYLLMLAAAQASKISKESAYLLSTTVARICDGQSRELADEFNIDRTVDSYMTTIGHKTASLTAAACQLGGLCADLPDDKIEALSRFGEAFGTAFQLIDDVLDFVSTAKNMGKPIGNDVKEGVYTLPLLIALNGPNRDGLQNLLSNDNHSQASLDKIAQILWDSGAIEQCLDEARQYNKLAVSALEVFENKAAGKSLSKLPDAYFEWALKKFR